MIVKMLRLRYRDIGPAGQSGRGCYIIPANEMIYYVMFRYLTFPSSSPAQGIRDPTAGALYRRSHHRRQESRSQAPKLRYLALFLFETIIGHVLLRIQSLLAWFVPIKSSCRIDF